MSDIKDGGPAFPTSNAQAEGMKLRDYFAAKAMQGELASQSEEYGSWAGDQDMLAHRAYLIADAMLKAREAS